MNDGTTDRWAGLTPRQRELLEHLARGLSNEEIGRALAISPATVRTHVTAILAQLGVRNRTEAAAVVLTRPSSSPAEVTRFLTRPAIGVLPVMASDQPEAAALAAALTDDLSGLLARCSWFPVIARSSMRGARSIGTTAHEIGQALDARFLVDATLRAAPRGWRLSVQIDDTHDGHNLWTERYDFEREPFAVLDELCAEIVARAYPVLSARVRAEVTSLADPDLSAWQMAHRAFDLQAGRDEEGSRIASELFAEAARCDPTLVMAHFGGGLCAYDAILNQWAPARAGRERLVAAAEACLRLAPHAAEGDFLLGRHHQTLGDHVSAVAMLESAIAKNPSFAAAHALLAQALMLCDRTDEALLRMQHAQRLGPRSFVAGLATLYFASGRYDDAVANAERSVASAPRYPFARALAAAAAYCAGHIERAADHMRLLHEAYPSFDTRGFLETFGADVPAVARLTHAIDALTPTAHVRRSS